MPNINLIRDQREQARKRESLSKGLMAGTLAVAVVCGLVCITFLVDTARLSLETAQVADRKAKLKPLLDELKSNQDKIDAMRPKIDTLEKAQAMTTRWGVILDHLANNTPDGTWLTSVKCQQSDPNHPLVLTFDGVSESQEKVGQAILALQTCKELQNVTLKDTSEKGGTTGAKEFDYEITAELATPADDKPKEKTT